MKKKTPPKKLALSPITLRNLGVHQLQKVAGGASMVYGSCNGCQEFQVDPDA